MRMHFFNAIAASVMLLSLTSCGTGATIYSITKGSENLQALTKITDDPKATVSSIGGSYTTPDLFLSIYDGKNRNIFRKENPLSASMQQITSGPNFNMYPWFSPKSNKLVFTYSTSTGATTRSKDDVYLMDLSKKAGLIPVTQTATTNEFNPTISEEGTIVVYQSNGGNNGEIWVKNLTTNETMLLGRGFCPKLSPDGKKIVFSRYKTDAYDSPSAIWVMDIDGSNVTQISASNDENAFSPAWSPDGKRIVFESITKGKKKDRDLYVMNADGTGLIQVTTNDSYDGDPFWCSDGYIYFISDRGSKKGDFQVWRFRY